MPGSAEAVLEEKDQEWIRVPLEKKIFLSKSSAFKEITFRYKSFS